MTIVGINRREAGIRQGLQRRTRKEERRIRRASRLERKERIKATFKATCAILQPYIDDLVKDAATLYKQGRDTGARTELVGVERHIVHQPYSALYVRALRDLVSRRLSKGSRFVVRIYLGGADYDEVWAALRIRKLGRTT